MGEIRVGQRFRAGHGAGRLVAEVVAVENDMIHLERWKGRGKGSTARRTPFSLPAAFLAGPRCGWVPTTDLAAARVAGG